METTLPALEIEALVERRLGSVFQFEQLPEGLASQTFGFSQGLSRYVVRVGNSTAGYSKDAFAWRTFSSDALPIPEIVSVDTFGDVAVCISRRAAGVRLCDIGDSAADLSKSIVDLLGVVGRTDTTATTGFGPFDARGQGPCRTWREYLLQVSAPGFCDWYLVRQRSDRQSIEAAILAVERLAPPDLPPRGLIHGDFGAANLLTDGRVMTAVIDWDRALIGDAAYDEANLLFWREPALQPVLDLLSTEHSGDPEWQRRVLCYQLRICLQELSESLAGLQPVNIRWLFTRCIELVDLAPHAD